MRKSDIDAMSQDVISSGALLPSSNSETAGLDRNYFSGLLEAHGFVLVELDEAATLIRIGSSWQAFTGHTVTDSLGRALTEFICADQATVVARRIRDGFERGCANLTFDFALQTVHGIHRWTRLQLLTLSDDGKRLLGVIGDNSPHYMAGGTMSPIPGHDRLTGLPNRILFLDRLESLVTEARRSGSMLALHSVDLDNFRKINDAFGHTVGDELLKALARRLTRLVRSEDFVARIGSDEFVVVQVGVRHPDNAVKLARRVGQAAKQRFALLGRDVHITCSIGVVLFPWDASAPDDLLRKAEIALEEAKLRGGGTDQFFESEAEVRLATSRWMEEELFKGFELRQFEVHFQPCVDLRTERIVGAEALVRWRHPEKGLIPPGEFIPIAESCGLIRILGPWILRTACRALRQWEEEGIPPLVIAVNVSAVQFVNDSVRDMVESCLVEFGLDPGRLELELTETAMLDGNSENVREQLADLSRMGVRLAIDDFGTGYGSLTHLRQLPLTKIKIDRRFVRNAVEDPADFAIVSVVASLGASLGMSVHAEGIETAEELAKARDAGCTEGQGFYFSRPLPEEQFARLLRESSRVSNPSLEGRAATVSELYERTIAEDRSARASLLDEI